MSFLILTQGSFVERLHCQVGSESWNRIHLVNKYINLQKVGLGLGNIQPNTSGNSGD